MSVLSRSCDPPARRRVTPQLAASSLTVLLLLGAATEGTAARGDCGQPFSNGARVTVSDCLYILQTVVGLQTCSPACICAVKGALPTAATDALRCLQSAVGLNVSLACASCDVQCGNDAAAALARGQEALEHQQLKRATEEYACAVAAAPTDPEANFFRAVTRLLEYVARDPELAGLLSFLGATGSRDVYDFTFDTSGSGPTPTAAQMKPVALGRLDEEISAALANLAVAKSDPGFQVIATDAMMENVLPGGDAVEIDRSDAMAVSAALQLLRFQIYFALASYSEKTLDGPLQDVDGVLQNDCGDAYVTANGDFFTLESFQNIQTARTAFAAALDDLIAALDAIESESDAQADDLLLSGAAVASSEHAVGVAESSERDILAALRASLDSPIDDMPGCDHGLALLLGNLFDQPLDRNDLPELAGSPCKIVSEFPDPTWNGIFPGAPTRKQLQTRATALLDCTGATGTAPRNDRCVTATAVASTPFFAFQATRAATVGIDDPILPDRCYLHVPMDVPVERTNTVWYRFTAPATGTVRINDHVHLDPFRELAGFLSTDDMATTYLTSLAVFSGTCSTLSFIDCGFAGSLTLSVTEGTTYYLQVAEALRLTDKGELMLTVVYRDPS